MRVMGTPHVTKAGLLTALRDAFTAIARGDTSVEGQHAADLPGGGDVIHYPAVLPDAGVYTVKISPYLPQPAGRAVVTAWTLVISLQTGRPIALLDAAGLTVERTAATSVLAADLLLPPDATQAAVVGYGPIGRAHARYLHHLRPDMAITAVARNRINDPDPPVAVADSIEEAVADADLVMLCTSAAEDVIDPRALAASAVITSISTNTPGAREIPADAVPALDVYVDAHTSLSIATELQTAVTNGWDPGEVRGDLADLITRSARPPRQDRPVFFRSVGLGIEDAAAAWTALQESRPPSPSTTG